VELRGHTDHLLTFHLSEFEIYLIDFQQEDLSLGIFKSVSLCLHQCMLLFLCNLNLDSFGGLI
jgi:hypothetical protein